MLKERRALSLVVDVALATVLAVVSIIGLRLLSALIVALVAGKVEPAATFLQTLDAGAVTGVTLGWVFTIATAAMRFARAEWEAMKAEVRRTDKDVLDRIEADVDAILRSSSGSGVERSARIDRMPRLEGV